ncbi:MAG: DNA polymerase III subunit gamma/tau [Gammaproteobacteria bacterium]|nr:DNA polymerase III subunit gamma/tau [Gammaproteobacteria bacterium]
MSYQVLARKWRPSNFSQVAGQAHVLKSLINALDNGRLHHAYLFTGTRGVGKTTLARILAKCLNCEVCVSSTPCGECGSCREISEGRFIDLIEVDAASRTKVEDTRDLLDNVQYTPSRGRFKVYLIDEVHMLSTHSFNALLKTLEEPPPHVKFLFATTDPQKLPITVLSRCLQFNLKNLSPQQITEYLLKVLQQEKIEFTEDAIWQIAAAANGSMRDALTLVDQAISYCQGNIATAGVVEMLGIPEQQKIYALLTSMSTGKVKDVFALILELAEHTPDYLHTLDGLLSALHRVALMQVVPDAIDNSLGDKVQLQSLSLTLTPEDVQLFYQMGIKGRDDLRLAADARSAFEMLLLRMMVFSPNYVVLDQRAQTGASAAVVAEVEKKKTRPALETATSKPVQPKASSSGLANNDVALTPAVGIPKTANHASNPPPLSALTHQVWLELFKTMNIGGITGNVLANSELVSVAGSTVSLVLDQTQSAVFSTELVPKLEQALSAFFKSEISVQISCGAVSAETPAMRSQRLQQERHIEMVNEFESDENVQELVKRFAGIIAKDSIAPVHERGSE